MTVCFPSLVKRKELLKSMVFRSITLRSLCWDDLKGNVMRQTQCVSCGCLVGLDRMNVWQSCLNDDDLKYCMLTTESHNSQGKTEKNQQSGPKSVTSSL